MEKQKVVHYLNQFFGGIGGEDKADCPVKIVEGVIGPGKQLSVLFGPQVDILATFICGDNFFSAENETAIAAWKAFLAQYQPNLVIAGPCFDAGRYGLACTGVAVAAEEMGIPTVLGMYEENPGREVMKGHSLVYAVPTVGARATKMNEALVSVVEMAQRILSGKKLGAAKEEGYLPRGIRKNTYLQKMASDRALDMLLQRLSGQVFSTEVPLPAYERISPAPPLIDLKQACLALVTEGGLVPEGNPDRLESMRATKWKKYDIRGMKTLPSGKYYCIHGGIDTTIVNEDPCRMIPLDAMRLLEADGRYQKLDDHSYVFAGGVAPIERAMRFGSEMGDALLLAGVDGAILTATWGTGTRCGATLAKEIEKKGIPTVLITALPNVARNIGVSRVVLGRAITHPAGNPNKAPKEELAERIQQLEKCFQALSTTVAEGEILIL